MKSELRRLVDTERGVEHAGPLEALILVVYWRLGLDYVVVEGPLGHEREEVEEGEFVEHVELLGGVNI